MGDFSPKTTSTSPIVLLSAGIGITPMVSALNHIRQVHPERTVIFGHATRTPASYAHKADVTAAQSVMRDLKVVTFYEQAEGEDQDPNVVQGFMQLDRLPVWLYAEADVYLCGPLAFMQAQWSGLSEAGVPSSQLHREVFGPELLDHLL
jgi:nitric oxide dioxygenase